MADRPLCYGTWTPSLPKCGACYVARACARRSPDPLHPAPGAPVQATVKEGVLPAPNFNLCFTLLSGQVFRWGRDIDGWWKGIGYGTVLHLRQDGDALLYRASSCRVATDAGDLEIESFLRWYLRLDAPPHVRVPRGDRRLREALRGMQGFRLVRQEPFECIISYVLSVNAAMSLTRRRIEFLARLLGEPVDLLGGRYWSFPLPGALADLNGPYLRNQRFGYRSEKVIRTARIVAARLREQKEKRGGPVGLACWRDLADGLYALPGSGVGLKVARCIDLFALDRLGAFAVDTWMRKMAEEWYGVTGSDARVNAWGENRYGECAGYAGEHLFAWYRENRARALGDRVVSFCASGNPSAYLPCERI